jgi:hypothetical protein
VIKGGDNTYINNLKKFRGDKNEIVELNEMELMTIDSGAKKKSCKRE